MTMMDSNLWTKTGKLTSFAFKCGYEENVDLAHVTLRLKWDNSAYFVYGFVNDNYYHQSFSKLKDARKFIRNINCR